MNAKRRFQLIVVLAMGLACHQVEAQKSGDPVPRGSTSDREVVLDAEALTSVYRDAMQPLQQHLRKSSLEKKYSDLAKMLEADKIEGGALLDALRSLRTELDSFLSGLPDVRTKLWAGAGDLGARVDDFRTVLARGRDAENNRNPAEAVGRNAYLAELADEILALPSGQRRQILEQRFEALSLLLDRAASAGPDLGGADQAILGNVLQFLVNIRSQLEIAAIRTSEIGVAIEQQRLLIDKYMMLIENLRVTDQLAEAIEELSSTSAPTFAKLAEHMKTMTQGLLKYTDQLNERAQKATQKLAVKSGGKKGGMSAAVLNSRIRAASKGNGANPKVVITEVGR